MLIYVRFVFFKNSITPALWKGRENWKDTVVLGVNKAHRRKYNRTTF